MKCVQHEPFKMTSFHRVNVIPDAFVTKAPNYQIPATRATINRDSGTQPTPGTVWEKKRVQTVALRPSESSIP